MLGGDQKIFIFKGSYPIRSRGLFSMRRLIPQGILWCGKGQPSGDGGGDGGGAGVTQMEWEHTFRCKGQPVGGQLISWRRVNKIGLHMGQCSPPHPLPPTVRNPGCQLKTKYLKPTSYYSKLL